VSQTKRLYWIDAQIRSGRYPNAAAVSETFGVSRRTAFADRDYLIHSLGAPLVLDRARGGWAYAETTYVLPFLAMSESEAAALRRSLLAAQEYLPPAEAGPVRAIAERLAAYVPPLTGAAPESMGGALRPSGVGVSAALLDGCLRAIRERRRLDLRYYSAGRDDTNDRAVQPYHLRYWRGEPYLIAWCEWRQGFRDFFLGRVREWRLLAPEGAFQRDPEFDPDAALRRGFDVRHGEALVTVRARFSPYQARWIRERRYHESQQTEEEANGGLVLTLRVAGMSEVGRWLRGYGAEVEVLEPASLRAELAAEAEKLKRIYGLLSE